MGLRPWELYEYDLDEFIHAMKGFERLQAYEWDRTRNIMFMVAKSVGAKSIKKVQDIMKLPLIDGGDNKAVRERLIERLKEYKKTHGGQNT